LTVNNLPTLEAWCHTVKTILQNYNLTLKFVAIANYQWEPDRPGHTGQSLNALQNQISWSKAQTNLVLNHIGGVLIPAFIYKLTKKRTIQLENGDVEETYEYKYIVNNPEILRLNQEQLCNEAMYKRQLLVSTMER